MKFHGEDQSFLGETLLRFASSGIFAYSTFNIVAGGLGVHTDLKNLLVFATGAITIIQVKWHFDKKVKFVLHPLKIIEIFILEYINKTIVNSNVQ